MRVSTFAAAAMAVFAGWTMAIFDNIPAAPHTYPPYNYTIAARDTLPGVKKCPDASGYQYNQEQITRAVEWGLYWLNHPPGSPGIPNGPNAVNTYYPWYRRGMGNVCLMKPDGSQAGEYEYPILTSDLSFNSTGGNSVYAGSDRVVFQADGTYCNNISYQKDPNGAPCADL